MTPAERVARGVALLDRVRPGWAQLVDLDRLDMQECAACVLGQLYGDFDDGCIANSLPLAAAAEHGFHHRLTSPRAGHRTVTAEYQALYEEWRRIIAWRQAVTR